MVQNMHWLERWPTIEKGNLSNRATAKLLLVFENGLASMDLNNQRAYDRALKKGRFSEAIRYFKLDDLIVRKIMWLLWNNEIRIEVVTFLGDDLCAALTDWLDEEDIGVVKVWSSTPERLARKIVYLPDLFAVYDPDPTRRFSYGAKGRVLKSAADLGV